MTRKRTNETTSAQGVLEHTVDEAAQVLGLSERHLWRILAAYRKEGAVALAHGNWGRQPANATPVGLRDRVVNLARERYTGANHTNLSELLAEREGLMLSWPTVRRIPVPAGSTIPSHRTTTSSSSIRRRRRCLRKGCCSNWMGATTPGWRTGDHG